MKKFLQRIHWWILSKRARYIERFINDILLTQGVISEDDANWLVPKNWEIVNKTEEISSWCYGYSRKQYPLKVVPKKKEDK